MLLVNKWAMVVTSSDIAFIGMEFWLRSRRADKTMEMAVTNFFHQVVGSTASAAERDTALQAQLADLRDLWIMNATEAKGENLEPAAPTHRRSFIESRTFSKLASFDSKAASWKDWAFKFENMVAAVVTSSKHT